MLGASPKLGVLTLRWSDWDLDPEDEMGEEPKSLASCMPVHGQPMLGLKTIIITDCPRLLDFPGPQQLPKLKDLIVRTFGRLEVGFENAAATVSRLDSLLLFGQPLCSSEQDMMQLMGASGALAMHGLVLGTAEGAQQGGQSSSCLYLRDLGARDLTIQELSIKAEQFLQCRCGACFACLQRAGCIEG
ncbi:g10024 [Coccomyxa viridis]|uniref:G10024 protein n=1 Tax=Coccomyxa viridis TaxID=1274662 RepID=A0ABP1G715_9CHLO